MEQEQAELIRQRLDRLQQFLQEDPGNERLRTEIFNHAMMLGQFELAQAQVDEMLGKSPGQPDWRNRQAIISLARKDYLSAGIVLASLLDEGEQNPEILYNLGFALFVQGRFEEAEQRLRPLVSGNLIQVPQAMPLWLRAQQRLGNVESALAEFETHASDPALTPEAFGIASLIAVDVERMADAKAWSAHALAISPRQPEALVAQGTIALAEQDVETAKRYLTQANELNPNDGRCWSALGYTYMLERQLDKALPALEQAVKFMPTHIGSWHALAWTRFLKQDYRGAQSAFEEALALDRNFAESHGGLAVVFVAQGQREQAQKHIELAQKLDRNNVSSLYASALMNGEIKDLQSFRVMARRVLGGRAGVSGNPMVDAVLARLQ